MAVRRLPAGELGSAGATLLDHHPRVIIDTFVAQRSTASHPASGAATVSLICQLTDAGASVTSDSQPGMPGRVVMGALKRPLATKSSIAEIAGLTRRFLIAIVAGAAGDRCSRRPCRWP